MYTEAKKLHLIEELLKVDNDKLLDEVELVLNRSKGEFPHSNTFQKFSGSLSLEEVDALERNINEGCEQIDEDDWK
jgi:hypothetical protein